MKKILSLVSIFVFTLSLVSCGGFQAKRLSGDESDEKALQITDKWVARDTENTVREILKQISEHKGFQEYLRKLGRQPKLFISEVQNQTSEAYFPIDDLNDELLNEFSMAGDYVLIDAAARESLLKEINYQNDGMVDPKDVKTIGKQTGADILIFGAVRMKPETMDGKTIKQYSINMRMTDLEKGVEVLRVRSKVNKYSEKGGAGW